MTRIDHALRQENAFVWAFAPERLTQGISSSLVGPWSAKKSAGLVNRHPLFIVTHSLMDSRISTASQMAQVLLAAFALLVVNASGGPLPGSAPELKIRQASSDSSNALDVLCSLTSVDGCPTTTAVAQTAADSPTTAAAEATTALASNGGSVIITGSCTLTSEAATTLVQTFDTLVTTDTFPAGLYCTCGDGIQAGASSKIDSIGLTSYYCATAGSPFLTSGASGSPTAISVATPSPTPGDKNNLGVSLPSQMIRYLD